MKKALLGAILSAATLVGCGVSPSIQPSVKSMAKPAVNLQAQSQQIKGLFAQSTMTTRALGAVKPEAPPVASFKKKVAERPMTDAEKNAPYADMLKAMFTEGQSHKGGPLTEVTADTLDPDLTMGAGSTFNELFLPTGNFGGLIEVIATEGKVTTYDWGFMPTFQFLQMRAAMGEPIMSIASADSVKSVSDLLNKAKISPVAGGDDQVCVYLNNMPRRKPDLSVEWFPAFVALTYKGHYADQKMVANAETGDIYFPKLDK